MKRVGQIFRASLVEGLKSNLEVSNNFFILSYSQISALQISDFRKKLKGLGASVFVSKNTIAQIALKDLEYQALAEKITGQTAIVCSESEVSVIAKAIVEFEKECEGVVVQAGLLEDRILDSAEVKKLSDLPSREALLATLLVTLQAPAARLAGALNAKSRDLLSILNQLSEKKGGN